MSYPFSPTGPDDRGSEPQGYPVPTSEQPPRLPAPNARLGRAAGIELRQELRPGAENRSSSLTVLAFRLIEPGNPQPLDVQLRGRTLSGTVRDGDWVEVVGPPDAMGRWDVDRLTNLTTASTVVMAGGRPSKATAVVGLIVLSVFVLVIVLVGLVVVVGLAST